MEQGATVGCPYCGSEFWLAIDPGGPRSEQFTSDCEICCRPIVFQASRNDDGALHVQASTEDESIGPHGGFR